ncbi:MAG: hypothetical protein JXA67_15780 [Micromonosporaceae bacterium]|nr:hypothetical protein [Micromonosporaceae bacterium]
MSDLLRIPQVSANLLPAEILEARRQRAARRSTIIAVIGVLVVLAGWFGHATYLTSTADDRLERAKETVGRLTGQQNAFADLTSAQAQSQLIGRQLATLMANDLPWSTLLTQLQASAPEGVLVTSVFGSLLSSAEEGSTGGAGGTAGSGGTGGEATGGGGTGGDVPEEQPAAGADQGVSGQPGASVERMVGTLSVSALAPDELGAAAYVDLLAAVPGLANPFVSDATRQEGVVQLTIRLDITSALLGGRYTAPSAQPSGGS